MNRTGVFVLSFLMLIAVLSAMEYTHSSGGIKI